MPAPTNRPPDITPEMCVAGRDLTEPKLAPDGSSIAFVATSAGSSAIVVVAADGGPERMLTTLPLPAAGRGLGGGCFDWLPDGSGIVYAAVGGELWLHSIAGGAVRRLTRHGPDARVEAPMVASRRELRRVRRRPGRGVAVLDRSRPPRRATRRRVGRLLLRPRDRGRRDRRDVDRVERAGHAVGRRPRRAPHIRRCRDAPCPSVQAACISPERCRTDRPSPSATTPAGSTSGSATARWSTNRTSTPARRGGWGSGRTPCHRTEVASPSRATSAASVASASSMSEPVT